MTETGKLVYLEDDGTLDLREYPVPDPEPGAIVAEVVRANVCGSDLHIWGGSHPLSELVMGHEVICRVHALGEGVETDYADQPVTEGDLIAPVYYRTCQRCPACRRGQFYLCHRRDESWLSDPDDPPHFNGTFGTHYYIDPDQYFYKVPEGVPATTAAAANCALSQVTFGIDDIDVSYGESVVIQGAGGLGLNSLAVCRERGAETIVIEGVGGRIDRAREFGADHVIDMREFESVEERSARVRELTDGIGADVGIEVAGVPEAFAEGIDLVRTGGRYLELGTVTPGSTVEFDVGRLTRNSITVSAMVRYQPWYLYKALSFLDAHADDYPYDDLIDAEFALEDVEAALEASAGREVTRATLAPHDGP